MARTWLSIRVDLVSGHGEDFWPRPGRIFAAARRHTFAQLAEAIDDALARWDRSHLHDFTLADETRLTTPYIDWEDTGPALDDRRTTLARLRAGEQFVYVFDFGDDWTHLCTVGPERIDPLDELGIVPDRPLPYWGWGWIPDQYGRRFDNDDGEAPVPENPGLASLPPLLPWWGRQERWERG
ncbi:MAG: plasmid pRiA4b ORF-3 family protein [Gaiella sp.]|nr:plasmid pRiA4b ORF-3 family protein [Gaiella sp.]